MSTTKRLIAKAYRLDTLAVVMPIWEIQLGNMLAETGTLRAILDLADAPGFHARRVALRALRVRGEFVDRRVVDCFVRALSDEQGWCRYDGAWGLAEAGRATPKILSALAKLAEGAQENPNIDDEVAMAKARALETLRILEAPVRAARARDFRELMRMRNALWPDVPESDHRRELRATLAGKPRSTLPLTTFVAQTGKSPLLCGFVEVGLRSHADGCDARKPVGFIEGWWVDPAHRKKDIGRRLLERAMDWAKAQGCREIASDTWIDNADSIRAHEALGFEISERLVSFRRFLP